MEQLDRIVLVDCPDFLACIDPFVMPDGGQMLTIHVDIHRASRTVLAEVRRAFDCFRRCTDAALFFFEPTPDDKKWERRWVRPFNLSFCGRVTCPDGLSRRFYLSTSHAFRPHDQQTERDD